jgi:hypothetical protein
VAEVLRAIGHRVGRVLARRGLESREARPDLSDGLAEVSPVLAQIMSASVQDAQILEALNSGNLDLHYEAVMAAGNWAVDAAWPHVAALVTSAETEKSLRLAAIGAAASIRPHDARGLLDDLADSDDHDIADAVHEALAMAEGPSGEDEDDELDDDDDGRR